MMAMRALFESYQDAGELIAVITISSATMNFNMMAQSLVIPIQISPPASLVNPEIAKIMKSKRP